MWWKNEDRETKTAIFGIIIRLHVVLVVAEVHLGLNFVVDGVRQAVICEGNRRSIWPSLRHFSKTRRPTTTEALYSEVGPTNLNSRSNVDEIEQEDFRQERSRDIEHRAWVTNDKVERSKEGCFVTTDFSTKTKEKRSLLSAYRRLWWSMLERWYLRRKKRRQRANSNQRLLRHLSTSSDDKHDTKATAVTRPKHILKPPKFDETTSFKRFWAQFQNCVRHNRCDWSTELVYLRNSLDKDFANVLWDYRKKMTESLSRLTKILKMRFGEKNFRRQASYWNTKPTKTEWWDLAEFAFGYTKTSCIIFSGYRIPNQRNDIKGLFSGCSAWQIRTSRWRFGKDIRRTWTQHYAGMWSRSRRLGLETVLRRTNVSSRSRSRVAGHCVLSGRFVHTVAAVR